ncbi:hypothetical protein ACH6CV_14505 [Bacillota bacterium Meth-B3]
MSTQDAYEAVRQAIIAIACGKVSYLQIGGRQVQFQDIEKLRALKNELAMELIAEASVPDLLGGAYVAFFDGR